MNLSPGLDLAVPFLLVLWIAKIAITKLTRREKINVKVPPYSFFYLLLLFFMAISLNWSGDKNISYHYLKLFASGYFFWFCSYNFKEIGKFGRFLIPIGLWYASLTLLNIIFGDTPKNSSLSLFLYAVPPLHHHHIGDLWAFVLIVLGLKISYSRKTLPRLLLATCYLLVFLGFYLLFISLSRSAYVALIAGSVFVLWKAKIRTRSRSKFKSFFLFYLYIFLSIFLFLYAGTQKNTLIAHGGYVIQGTTSFWNNPLGIGVGNFKNTGRVVNIGSVQFDGSTSSAHNIILEILSGLGIFGLPFLIWLYHVLKSLMLKNYPKRFLVPASGYITFFINFFFDYTYLIPVMFWSWFLFLGIFQAYQKRD